MRLDLSKLLHSKRRRRTLGLDQRLNLIDRYLDLEIPKTGDGSAGVGLARASVKSKLGATFFNASLCHRNASTVSIRLRAYSALRAANHSFTFLHESRYEIQSACLNRSNRIS